MTVNESLGQVLITGTSTGIGRACAVQLARHGFLVWAGVRTPTDAEALQQVGMGTSRGIRPIQLEVTDASSIRRAEEEIRSHAGDQGLCGLVNNAGICVVSPAEFIPLNEWRRQFEVNLFGVIALTQAMLPLLRVHNSRSRRLKSRIVNIGSVTGEISTPLFSAYASSKFALRAFNDALRLELRPEGIHVCLIVPGAIQSEIWRKERESLNALTMDLPARNVYGALIDNVAGYVFGCAQNALPAQRVSKIVQRCFTSPRPRNEYPIGPDAKIGALAKRFIPGRLLDLLLAKTLGVPRNNSHESSALTELNASATNEPLPAPE